MGILEGVGNVIGGCAGFLVAGPRGAAIGASLGAGLAGDRDRVMQAYGAAQYRASPEEQAARAMGMMNLYATPRTPTLADHLDTSGDWREMERPMLPPRRYFETEARRDLDRLCPED